MQKCTRKDEESTKSRLELRLLMWHQVEAFLLGTPVRWWVLTPLHRLSQRTPVL